MLTSVSPITESGPGFGGAKRQKSSTEFTNIYVQTVYSSQLIKRFATHRRHSGTSTSHYYLCHTCSCPTGLVLTVPERSREGRSHCTVPPRQQQV